ncbi:unnamed protein product [marine sediment metagenome]|uniref:Uncharacterized protein n=1 Tax=marine sediment metagenome TaxID=412755 RepID=X1BZ76_9ZZZZ
MRSQCVINIFIVLLVISLAVSLASTEGDVLNVGVTMKIGFARVEITPPLGTLIRGHPVSLPAQGVESNLYATAMYLDDGKTKVVLLLFTVSLRLKISVNLSGNPMVWCLLSTRWKKELQNFADLKIILVDISVCEVYHL